MKDIKTSSVIMKNNLKYFTILFVNLILCLIIFFYYTKNFFNIKPCQPSYKGLILKSQIYIHLLFSYFIMLITFYFLNLTNLPVGTIVILILSF